MMMAAGLLSGAALACVQVGKLPPAAQGTPKVGDKAPEFTLPDATGKPTKLTGLLAQPSAASEKGSWVLLIFYRGYW